MARTAAKNFIKYLKRDSLSTLLDFGVLRAPFQS
jgi:hypothetical protein